MNTIVRESDKGGWMLIETEDAHNAVWVPASEVTGVRRGAARAGR